MGNKKIVVSTDFRKELWKIMPGYNWTVHRDPRYLTTSIKSCISATGIQTMGFNRISTLHVTRREKDNGVEYEVKSSGFGKKAPWLSSCTDTTLARALRGLQEDYESIASNYAAHARDLQNGRKK